MKRRLLALAAALALLAGACSEDGASTLPADGTASAAAGSTTSTSAPPTTTATTVAPSDIATRPYEVEQSTATFVDTTRILPAGSQTDEQPTRSIDVWFDAPITDEPRPLLIFAHGLTGHPRSHEMLRAHLAVEGFVVVSPAFPLTNSDVPGAVSNAGDTEEQVVDVSFLIDSVLADADLGPRIDPGRIGMIGHSLGGLTTAGAALSPTGDPRISAAVVMSAGYGQVRPGASVMTVHGDLDQLVPYSSSTTSYARATGRRILVTLVGGDHLTGILDDDTDLGVALRGLSAAFFARELDVDDGQVAEIDELPLENVTVEAATPEGDLEDWRDYFSG